MKVKWGAIVTDGRGKIGGHVASKNKAGSYFRTKVSPANPQSDSQFNVRNRFTSLSQSWRSLGEAHRAAWNNAVADYAKTDIFGDLRNPSGFNLYQRLNNNLMIANQAILTEPLNPAAVEVVTAGTLTATNDIEAFSLAFSPTVQSDNYVKVFATNGISAGKSFVKNEYRLISVLQPAATSPANLLSDYKAVFGHVPAAGMKVFVKLECINGVTGQTGTPSVTSAIVT